jgi:fatty-acyl-CoA synthase
VIESHEPAPRIPGHADDIYMLYTGGTTGMPKGVRYTHGVFPLMMSAAGAGIYGIPPAADADELLRFADVLERPPVWLAACPQMHGTGMWLGTMAPLLMKGTVVTLTSRSFDAHELWRAVEPHAVEAVVIVGDAFAKPMLRALDETSYEVPSLKAILSSGVMWSTEVKEGLLRHLDVMLYDGLNSSEGAMGATISTRADIGSTAKFIKNPAVKVVTDDAIPDPSRPRLELHQHRRREGLSRGGRGGDQVASRGLRLPGRRRPPTSGSANASSPSRRCSPMQMARGANCFRPLPSGSLGTSSPSR